MPLRRKYLVFFNVNWVNMFKIIQCIKIWNDRSEISREIAGQKPLKICPPFTRTALEKPAIILWAVFTQDLARDVIRASLSGVWQREQYNISKKQLGDLSHLIDGWEFWVLRVWRQTPGAPARPNPFPRSRSFAVRVMADSDNRKTTLQ